MAKDIKKPKMEIEAEAISSEEIAKENSLVEGVKDKPGIIKSPKIITPESKFAWKPKTLIGKQVVSGEITDLNKLLSEGKRLLEAEIVDILLPNMQTDLLLIGQAKGKFGGGQRRVFKTTQKKTKEGNKPKFAAFGVVGNEDGIVGIGYGKSKETVPAREKAFRMAKLNIMKIKRGCGSWACNCGEPHSIPFKVIGKCGSSVIKIMPAPKGIGLKIKKECAKILKLAGIKDVWSKTYGMTKTKINLVKACDAALKKLTETKIQINHIEQLGIISGPIQSNVIDKEFTKSIKSPEAEE